MGSISEMTVFFLAFKPSCLHQLSMLPLVQATIALYLFSLPSQALSGELGKKAAEREAAACGPRAVYLLLQDLGVSAKYEQLHDAVNLSQDGASLSELAKCVRSYGIPCSIRRMDPSDLLRCRPPLIAFMRPMPGGGKSGHFNYIRSVSPEGLEAIEPVSCQRIPLWRWRSFSGGWSGICLVLDGPRIKARDPLFLLSFINLALFGMVFWRSARISRASKPSPYQLSLIAVLCVPVLPGQVLGRPPAADDLIRSHERGGLNAVALMLGLLTGDSSASFAVLAGKANSDMTIEEVRCLLNRRGCPTNLRSIRFAELSRAVPCISLLRYGNDRAGSYCIILAASEDLVTVLRTGPMVVEVIPTDEFRRRWTGHALIAGEVQSTAHPPRRQFLLMCGIGLLVGVAIVRLWKPRAFGKRHTHP